MNNHNAVKYGQVLTRSSKRRHQAAAAANPKPVSDAPKNPKVRLFDHVLCLAKVMAQGRLNTFVPVWLLI